MIRIADYDDAWPMRFATIKAYISDAMTTAGVPVASIEHVGSTSVPGLAAKPVIDCDVVVEKSVVGSASRALETVGFRPLGDLGIPDRWAFEAPERLGATNVYVTVEGSLSLRNHLATRTILRTRPDLREAYAAAKRDAAASATDIDDYVERKSDVLQEILRAGGLTDEERAAIRGVNAQ